MKNNILVILFILFLAACSEEEAVEDNRNGRVEFSLQTKAGSSNGRSAEDDVSHILLSLADEQGNIILNKEEVSLIKVGSYFVTQSLELNSGNYQIIEFMVLNQDNEAIYITPIAGSDKAQFVVSPLPIDIVVVPEGYVSIPVEVLRVEEDDQPSDFGLAEFAIHLSDPILLQLSVEQNGQPVSGVIEVSGMKDGFEIFELNLDVGPSGKKSRIYDNIDSVRFTLTSPQRIEQFHTVEELKQTADVLFSLGAATSLEIEVQGVSTDFEGALATLEGHNGIFKAELERDPSNQSIRANFQSVPLGEYNIFLSIYEEEYFKEIKEADKSLLSGWESVNRLNIVNDKSQFLVNGPNSPGAPADLDPEWSERYFYRLNEPDISTGDLIWSVPAMPCEFDLRFIPEYLELQPNYIYIDYFVHDEENGSQPIAFLECYEQCDPMETVTTFNEALVENESNSNLCGSKDWDIADAIMMIDFKDDNVDEFLVFFMRWDTEGPHLDILEHSSVNGKGMDALYLERRKSARQVLENLEITN
ncbi:MAG: hypothetical protein AAF693_15100 [Bacteroidota bacterium]